MASIPLTEEQVAADWVVLNFENVGLTDEQFVDLCSDNDDLILEFTARKELVIMTPPAGKTGLRNGAISTDLEIWARQDGTGVTFASNTVFGLPNGAKRGPDACWVSRSRWDALSDEQQDKPAPFCPEFVVELMSPSDRRPVRFRMVQAKTAEYIQTGAQLGWLIDPYQKKVYIYRPGEPVECLENPATIQGDPVLPGFLFRVSGIW